MWRVGVLVAVTAGQALAGPGPCSVDGIWNALGSGDGAGRLVNLSQVCWSLFVNCSELVHSEIGPGVHCSAMQCDARCMIVLAGLWVDR